MSPENVTLKHIIAQLKTVPSEFQESLTEQVNILDRNLRSWRNTHLGIARTYLAPGIVGTGNQGVQYLEQNLAVPTMYNRAEQTADSHGEPSASGPLHVSPSFSVLSDG